MGPSGDVCLEFQLRISDGFAPGIASSPTKHPGLGHPASLLPHGVQQVTGLFKDNVIVFPSDVPPPLSETLSWRQLWRSGAFALLDLVWDTSFSGLAADRGLQLGIGQRPLEALDIQGALQPIAYAAGGNPHGFVDLAPFESRMTFREEEPPRELQVLAELAARPADDRPAVTLTLPLSVVLTAHEERRHKTRENPGTAGTLLELAEDPAYGGPVAISKPDFACALADRILAEVSESPGDDEAIEALRRRRPLLAFVFDRVLPVLTGPRWQ